MMKAKMNTQIFRRFSQYQAGWENVSVQSIEPEEKENSREEHAGQFFVCFSLNISLIKYHRQIYEDFTPK